MQVKVLQDEKREGGLDFFRVVAALLVIAIHTSPLSSISAEADFFVTRVLARTAVPFFFMVTGQFVLGNNMYCLENKQGRIWGQIKKLLILYGIASFMYFPIGIYAGHFQGIHFSDVLRMIVFDGTFYHLWYFPAVILGIAVVWILGRIWSLKELTFITGFLYMIGLLGDSYFGFVEMMPPLKHLYEIGFCISSYTRNGLFFAPLFLVLGMWMGKEKKVSAEKSKTIYYGIGFGLSFLFMTAEAFLLRHFDMQRHDSMYIFLVPVMIFLYQMLIHGKGKKRPGLRRFSLWIYILHPAMILVVRVLARVSGMKLAVENSLLHYIGVTICSLLAAGAVSFLSWILRRKNSCMKENAKVDKDIHVIESIKEDSAKGRAWIEIDRNALQNNVEVIRRRLPKNCQLMPAVKANAYGHGAVLIAGELQKMGIETFCVACVAEGVELRKAGIEGEILILGYTNPAEFETVYQYKLTQTVIDYEYAMLLQQFGKKIHVHVAVDTGMNRLGERHENIDKIVEIFKMSNLMINGIFTHLSACDGIKVSERRYTDEQLCKFKAVIKALRERGIAVPKVHMHASYGVLNCACVEGDYARVGIALYGMLSTKEDTRLWGQDLKPVLSLKTRIVNIKEVHEGETVGYGLEELAKEDGKIAALPIGYADGLPRELSYGKGFVLVKGSKVPITGRICMDQTLIDVKGIEGLKEGDEVIIIGKEGEHEITACDLAKQAGTISNEILSRLGSRLKRI